MADTMNQLENPVTGAGEIWITIKDASDLLGISERHAWNIISANAFKTQKLLNKKRKKAYVLRADIEKFHKEEQERQTLAALGGSSPSEMSEMSEKIREFEISESEALRLSEKGQALSERALKVKNLPALLSEMHQKQETLAKDAAKWRVTAMWLGVLGLMLSGSLTYYLRDTKKALSEREKAISEKDKTISEGQKAISELSQQALALSEREKRALTTLSEREIYIKRLETGLTNETLTQIRKTDNDKGGL